MAARRAVAVLFSAALQRTGARTSYLLDDGWKFQEVGQGPGNATCKEEMFPVSLEGKFCKGLAKEPMAKSMEACMQACCEDVTCDTFQWCADGKDCKPSGTCWLGKKSDCKHPGPGWVGRGRDVTPDPPTPVGGECSEPQCKPEFDDGAWQTVDVPHDFVITHNFSRKGDVNTGYLPYGVGWYRKHITFPASAKGQTVLLDFDGTQAHSSIFLDGKALGGHESGYTPYQFQLDGDDVAGKTLLLAAKINANFPDGWWYDGGGIYRHVWLTVLPRVRVAGGVYGEGVYAPALVTGKIANGMADAELVPSVEIVNDGTSDQTVKVTFEVTDSSGLRIALAGTSLTIPAKSVGNASVHAMALKSAKLWSPESPTLYKLHSYLESGKASDEVETTFGVRKTRWDAELGFFLNDEPVKIRGYCNHQDFAGMGVAMPDSFQDYRIRRLKEMGGNAWRTSHNMPNHALLDAADRLGMLVWDENHRNGQPEEARLLVRRDRNHPSVIIWSICNERLCAGSLDEARQIKEVFHSNDPLMGRVVSANNNDWNGANTVLDLQGFDYGTHYYDQWHKRAPHIPAISSETSSAVSDRGEYANDGKSGHVRGYDTEFPPWAQTAETAWNGINDRSFIAGGFTWTGFDYKGEPTPYAWPDVNSHFGILDMAGFPKDRYYWYQANYLRPDPPLVHLFPHWNWASAKYGSGPHLLNCSGMCQQETVEVWAFSNADEVELFLNGESQGRRPCGPRYHASWTKVAYAPGKIEAFAFQRAGTKVLARAAVETTGRAASIRASIKDGVGASGIEADNSDVALVQVEVLDAQGRMVPVGSEDVSFSVTGPGKLIGTGNGDPASHTNDKSATRETFHGLALAVIQATHEVGTVTVTASAGSLGSSTVSIQSRRPASPKKRLPETALFTV